MIEPISYLNGRLIPYSQACLPVSDMGLVYGASVTEMIRTFGGECFRLDAHVARLFRSLTRVGIAVPLAPSKLRDITLEVVECNKPLVPPTHDLGILQFVTAGQNLTYLGGAARQTYREPTICVHTFPLPFELWAARYETGQHLITPRIRQIPAECLDPTVKYRSRLHWFLADEEVRRIDSQAQALLLDQNGGVTETAAGNFFIVSYGTILTPPDGTVLGGISREVVRELAGQLDLPLREQELRPEDVAAAEEAFTTSTPTCILPVTQFNQQPVGDGRPGPIYRRLLAAWNDLVGCDIAAQMQTGARERAV